MKKAFPAGDMAHYGFGWPTTCGTMRKARHREQQRIGWCFTLSAAAYNLIRLAKLLTTA